MTMEQLRLDELNTIGLVNHALNEEYHLEYYLHRDVPLRHSGSSVYRELTDKEKEALVSFSELVEDDYSFAVGRLIILGAFENDLFAPYRNHRPIDVDLDKERGYLLANTYLKRVCGIPVDLFENHIPEPVQEIRDKNWYRERLINLGLKTSRKSRS